ncbi:MAG: urea ABC transporter substrate-binding protein [Methylococcales bacterium]
MSRTYPIYLVIVTVLIFIIIQSCSKEKPTVRIGIIHSLSGTMAFSERPLVDVLILAIEEVNNKGGVLGHKIVPIIVDGRSTPDIFAKEAERLIVEEHVSAIFGCWTSACRKAVKPVVEKYQHLLFYPVQYEGLEQSPNIIYTGATANQQIIPSITWALNHLGTRFFLIGSDYIFPRTASVIIKDLLVAQQGEIVAEHYIPLGENKVSSIIDDIERLQPDVILNTLNGDSNIAFFEALNKIKSPPVISFRIAEPELAKIGAKLMFGHYSVWSYFQTIDSIENKDFVTNIKKRFGEQTVVSDPMEASYIGFQLWIKAVEHADSFEPLRVNAVIGTESLNAPEGVVAVDSLTHHLWKIARIGQARKDGQFTIVWQSNMPIQPVPYPSYRSKKDWEKIAERLSEGEYTR